MERSEIAADTNEIRILIERYADAVNRRDPAALTNLWADDGRWSVPESEALREVNGRTAIGQAWEGLMSLFPVAFFLCMPGHIAIDGDEAETRAYGQEVVRDQDGKLSTAVGYYDDRFIKRDGQWLFAAREWRTICRYQPQEL